MVVDEEMEIDDYSTRDRSRSPDRSHSRRDRSRSPADYGRRGGRDSRDSRDSRRGGPRGGRGGSRGGRFDRGGRGGGDFRGGRGGFRGDRDRDSHYRDDGRDQKERNHSNTIFVGNLPFNCQWYELKDHFKSIGEVVRADIVTSRGRSKGMGTVEFKDSESVDKAIDEFNHTDFLSREIFVRQDHPPPSEDSRPPRYDDDRRTGGERLAARLDSRPERGSVRERVEREPVPEGCEIFVGNLPFRTNWQALKDLFKTVGHVVRADVRLDDRGRSKGFGTVIFENREDAIAAREQYDQYELDGRRIDVREGKSFNNSASSASGSKNAGPRQHAPINKNSPFTENAIGGGSIPIETIFADNLPFATTNDDLFDLFETIGKVEQAEIKYTPEGRSSGSAVVKFVNTDDAAAAIEKLNNYEYGNRPLQLSYASIISSEEPQEQVPVQEQQQQQQVVDQQQPEELIQQEPQQQQEEQQPQVIEPVEETADIEIA